MNKDLDELQDIVKMLDGLLKDRQGTLMWNQLLIENIKNLKKWMNKVGVDFW